MGGAEKRPPARELILRPALPRGQRCWAMRCGCSCPTEGPSAHPGLSEGGLERCVPPLTNPVLLGDAPSHPPGANLVHPLPVETQRCKSGFPIKGVDN